MNYKKLFDKINGHQMDDYGDLLNEYANALHAVLELHKPCRIDKDMTYCEGCSNSAFFPWEYCPTIEAIEKVLS